MGLKLNLRNIPGRVGWEVGLMEGAPRKYQGKLSLPGPVTFSCLSTLSLSKMQICETVITAASPSFVGPFFFFFWLTFFPHPSAQCLTHITVDTNPYLMNV